MDSDLSRGVVLSSLLTIDHFTFVCLVTWPINEIEAGTHDLEPTTLLCSCNGVFTDRFIFRLNFPRMRLPQEPDDQLQEIKLTS